MDQETKDFLQKEFKKVANRLDQITEELIRVKSHVGSLERRIISLEEADTALSIEVHRVLQRVPEFA